MDIKLRFSASGRSIALPEAGYGHFAGQVDHFGLLFPAPEVARMKKVCYVDDGLKVICSG